MQASNEAANTRPISRSNTELNVAEMTWTCSFCGGKSSAASIRPHTLTENKLEQFTGEIYLF